MEALVRFVETHLVLLSPRASSRHSDDGMPLRG
jgi:hypothetical protein